MQESFLPPAFVPSFYRDNSAELVHLSDEEALRHFQEEGIAKGYAGSIGSSRENLLGFARNEHSILEIGPFHAPSVVGDNVRYMDVLTTDELLNAVRKAGHDTSNVPNIHYVAPSGGFDMVDRQFSAVFSGHCIEHQPDLIRHFEGVSGILAEGGRYYIACPDKRYCFDHYVPESGISDILAAYHARRRFHHPRSFIAQRLHGTHNDANRHWASDHGQQRYETYGNVKAEILEHLPGEDRYHDVHAWQFTPASFFAIMTFLYEAGLTDLAVERVYHTRFRTQEFTAVLRKGLHPTAQESAFIPEASLHTRLQNIAAEISSRTNGLQASQARSQEEIARLKLELEQMRDVHARTSIENESLRHRVSGLLSSHSWQVTRPLRKISEYLRPSARE
ncbi:MAG: hypothetical protein JSR41_24665 [Proteobacteria bacterium]|nr:hypothetical protein [Pseudomonadota bacterium]